MQPDTIIEQEVEQRFAYHAPKDYQVQQYERIRAFAKDMGIMIVQMCPSCQERSIALTHLDEVVMFANAAIARNT